MEKIKINVFGCCVSRDSLDIHKERYEVPRYAAFISPYTALSGEKVDISVEELKKAGLSGIEARGIALDGNCGVIDFFKEQKADWILLDIADARGTVAKWGDILLTLVGNESKKRKAIETVLSLNNPVLTPAWRLSIEELENRTATLLDKILELYDVQRIIFHEFFKVREYISTNGYLCQYSKMHLDLADKYYDIHKRLLAFSEKKLKGCHVLQSPDHVLGDEKNRWGLAPLHFCREYYEYADQAIQIITSGCEDEGVQLIRLKNKYSELFLQMRQEAKHKNESDNVVT